jgi:hypothetical protein
VTNVAAIRSGLYGYNAAGTCCVLAGGIFYKASDGAVLVGVFGACLASLLTVGFQGAFSGLPVLTFPFITSAWIIMLSRSKWLNDTSDGILRPLMRRMSSRQALKFSPDRFKIPMLDYYPKFMAKSSRNSSRNASSSNLVGNETELFERIKRKNNSLTSNGSGFFGSFTSLPSQQKMSKVFSMTSLSGDDKVLDDIIEETPSQMIGKSHSNKGSPRGRSGSSGDEEAGHNSNTFASKSKSKKESPSSGFGGTVAVRNTTSSSKKYGKPSSVSSKKFSIKDVTAAIIETNREMKIEEMLAVEQEGRVYNFNNDDYDSNSDDGMIGGIDV